MFRTALIILTVALTASVSGQAQAATQQQEAMGAPATEGNLNKDLSPGYAAVANPNTLWSITMTCAVPGPKPRPLLVPAGKKPTDFCPATAITYHLSINTPVPAARRGAPEQSPARPGAPVSPETPAHPP